MNTKILSAIDIYHIVQFVGVNRLMDVMIERLTEALESYNPQQTIIPVRSGFSYTEPQPGLIEWMPVMQHSDQIAIKVVGYHPRNPQSFHLPTIISTISVYDPLKGQLKALADATFITALRTGAASAVASKYLASSRSSVVGIIGAGAQAVTQLHALSRIFPIQKVFVYDILPGITQSFIKRTALMDLDIIPMESNDLDQLVASVDILCTCTSVEAGEGPVFQDTNVKPWLHINAVGADFPGKFEVPYSVLHRSAVCPDFRDQAIAEGECQQLDAHHAAEEIGPELFELVQNSSQYTSLRETNTVFDSTGWALEDQIAINMMLDYAEILEVGTLLEIEQLQGDPQNPYELIDLAQIKTKI
jgi:ornithine cyclodeaminase/alanine dehydrogenase-like protein (mu-crystallin family)